MTNQRSALPDDFIDRVRVALVRLVTEDIHLLHVDVHERTIVGSLMAQLRPLFPEWHVDVEYDRDGFGRKQIRMPYHPEFNRRNRKVMFPFPDIIIHRRGTPLNLVAMEIKSSSNKNWKQYRRDRFKLECYKRDPLCYRSALFVVVNTDGTLGAPCTIEEI